MLLSRKCCIITLVIRMEYINKINKELYDYLNKKILPEYNNNIGGHDVEHINYVTKRCFELIDEFMLDVNFNMIYTIAIFHDIGYHENPDEHEKVSAKIYMSDEYVKKFFTDEENKIIYEAIVDHRASLEYEARSIYGKIVSSADREISVENMLIRSLKYQKDKHILENPTLNEVIEYSFKKLSSKYGKNNGYAKMYFKDKKYLDYIEKINILLDNKDLFICEEKKIANKINLF